MDRLWKEEEGLDLRLNGQAHDMFSRIFRLRIYEVFLPNIIFVLIFSNAQHWGKNPFLTNEEFVFYFQLRNICEEIR